MKQEVGFVGYECEDIVFYLARMLSFLGKTTAVLDRTEHRSVIGICGNAGKSANILISESLDEILESECSVILKVFGYQPLWEEIQECKDVFLVTDGSSFWTKLLAKVQIGYKSCHMIIRDMVSMNYSEKYLVFLSEQNIGDCFLLFLDKSDTKNRYSLGIEKNTPLRYLSEDMKELLQELVLRIDMSINQKQLYVAQKKA